MNKIAEIRTEFVDFIPKELKEGVLYVSEKYRTASHLCACGCGSKVVTPLKPGGWKVQMEGGKVSVTPSIGSWALNCKSHYWITKNKVIWARQWSQNEIDAGRRADQLEREQHFDIRQKETVWQKLLKWLFG